MIKTYSVFAVSQMLNVNEETIRRWIRDGKLLAKRAVGRSGNSILLEDIVSFANKPPRAHLLSLDIWLTTNNIPFERVEDPKTLTLSERSKILASLTTGTAASTIASAAIPATLAASAAGLVSGVVGLGVAGVAYGTTKIVRKLYQTYTIRLLSDNEIESTPKETPMSLPIETTEDVIKTESSITLPKEHAENTSGLSSIFEEITQTKQLLDAGIITAEEFAAIKAKLIAKI